MRLKRRCDRNRPILGPTALLSVPLLVESKHSPYNPVTQHRDIEVDQKTGFPGAHAQIGEELGFMDGSYMLDRLDFYDYGAGHNHVHSISTSEFE